MTPKLILLIKAPIIHGHLETPEVEMRCCTGAAGAAAEAALGIPKPNPQR